MSIVVIAFWLLKDFDLVQQVLPALNKWRYVLVFKFASNIVFVGVIAYVLMRLPIGSAKIRGGISTRFTLCREPRSLPAMNG